MRCASSRTGYRRNVLLRAVITSSSPSRLDAWYAGHVTTTTTLLRTPSSIITRADEVLCTMSDGTSITLAWSKLTTILGDDLVPIGAHFEARRVPTDAELAASRGLNLSRSPQG
jgi:hypothetical protein